MRGSQRNLAAFREKMGENYDLTMWENIWENYENICVYIYIYYIYIYIWENYWNYGDNYREICEKVWDNCWETMGSRWCPVPFLGPKLLNSLGSVGKYDQTSFMGEHQATNNGLRLLEEYMNVGGFIIKSGAFNMVDIC